MTSHTHNKFLWKICSLCMALTIGVVLWLGYELGVLFPGSAKAQDKKDGVVSIAPTTSDLDKTLEARNKALLQREEIVSRREQKVSEKEKALLSQVARTEKIMSELKAKVSQLEIEKNSQIEAFKGIYEKMEPKKAAKILGGMEVELSSQIIGSMHQDKAAQVLSQIPPDRARLISEQYLGRRELSSKGAENKAEDNQESVGAASNIQKGGVK